MINSDFPAAMHVNEYRAGEARHLEQEPSRKLAMTAGLTKSSYELRQVWKDNPDTYIVLLKGAVAAYKQNALVEELLRGAIARLISVIDDDETNNDLINTAMGIVLTGEPAEES